MMKKLLIACLVTVMLVGAGCNTVKGVGKDIERGGQKVQGVSGK
jgi:predicted small secreted protein